MTSHSYRTSVHWDGSTAAGVRGWSRDHHAATNPPTVPLELSADAAFRGTAERLNPEQLLVVAASSCQLLSFLAVAARAGVEVLAYDDVATSSLVLGPHDGAQGGGRLSTIDIRATVEVAPGTAVDHVQELAARAHEECYVARSLAVPVVVETLVVTR